jgi:hypothetical protein
VLVPILISMGTGANCRFSGSYIESGDVGRSSSTGAGVSTVSLVGVSSAICVSISVHLAPRYGFDSLSVRRQYHLSPRYRSVSGSLDSLVAAVT